MSDSVDCVTHLISSINSSPRLQNMIFNKSKDDKTENLTEYLNAICDYVHSTKSFPNMTKNGHKDNHNNLRPEHTMSNNCSSFRLNYRISKITYL